MTSLIGERFGVYRLRSELGAGGMGTVYLAEAEESTPLVRRGQTVALKVIHPHLLGTPGFFKRFLREAELGRKVQHKNVVRTIEVDATLFGARQVNYMVLEYVEGKHLRTLLNELATIPEALLREIALQIARGLVAIHDQSIVHRDLKPENVMITEDQRVRIMDLGVAKLAEATMAITHEGQFSGSVLYAAPEQLRDEDSGPLADLYSLGVLLYELATGQNPFRRDSAGAVIEAHLSFEPQPARDLNPDLTAFFCELIATLLSKDPSRRFDSAAAVHQVLEQGERSIWWAAREQELRVRRAHLPTIPVRRETHLYGRDEELALLRDAWDRARMGLGATVLVEGEAGLGKTRLVDAFVSRLESEDAHVLYGSYPPSGGIGGLSEAILGKFGSGGLEQALAPYLDAVPSLVPSLAALARHESPPRPLRGDALHAVCCHLLRALAREKPTLWVVEDLQFAPGDSRALALALARASTPHRVLLLITSRPGLPEHTVAHFGKLPGFVRVGLSRLSPREVIELLRDAFKSEMLADKLGAKIAYKSDGVPFFVFEMIRGLKEGQFVKELPDGTWVETRVIDEIGVPSAVKGLVQARLGDLSKEERALLDVGAVQGYEFDPDLVARVLRRRRFDLLQDLAAIERRSGVVRATGREYRFDHHQIQEVIYLDLPQSLREESHALLVGAFTERAGMIPDESDRVPGETAFFLAWHSLRGSRPEDGLPYLRRALAHLGNGFRNELALDLSGRALEIEGLLEGRQRVRVLQKRAALLNPLGRAQEEREVLEEALQLADELDEPVLRAQVRQRLGWHLQSVGEYDEALATLGEAGELARDGGTPKLEAEVLLNLGTTMHRRGDYEGARRYQGQALVRAQEIPDRRLEGNAHLNLGNALFRLGEYERAGELFGQALAIARELGHRDEEARAIGNLGTVCSRLGRHEEAMQHHQTNLEIAKEIGNRRGEAVATSNVADGLVAFGRLAEARELYARRLAIAREVGDKSGESIALTDLGALYACFGDHAGAREYLEAAQERQTGLGARRWEAYTLYTMGLAAESAGDAQAAATHHEASLKLRREMADSEGTMDSLVALGRCTGARPHLEEALAMAREFNSPALRVLAAAHLGDAKALAGHEEDLTHQEKMEAHFALHKASRDRAHLEEAHRLLLHLRDHTPATYRETMLHDVALHRGIIAAHASS